jgi:hypothetical protein
MIEGSEFESRWSQEFSLLYNVQFDSEAHAVPIKWAREIKLLGCEAGHSPCGGQENVDLYIDSPYIFTA